MSYHVHFDADLGGPEPITIGPDHLNYTSNCGNMFELAVGRRLPKLDGLPAALVARLLHRAVERMDAQPEVFAAMNPHNEWGDSKSARDWLEQIATACDLMPRATVRVHA